MWLFLFLSNYPFWQWWAPFVWLTLWFRKEHISPISYSSIFGIFVLFHLFQYYWIVYPLVDNLKVNYALATIGVLFIIAVHSLYIPLLIAIRRNSAVLKNFPVISWVMLWLTFEWLKINSLGGFPWGSFALSQIDAFYASFTFPILGASGTCAVIALLSGLFASSRYLLSLFVVLVIAFVAYPLERPAPLDKSWLVRAYQIQFNPKESGELDRAITLLKNAQQTPAINVFPEGIVSISSNDLEYLKESPSLLDISNPHPGTLIFGANIKSGDVVHNTAQIVSSHGKTDGIKKVHLVPFGEQTPIGFKWLGDILGYNPMFQPGEMMLPVKLNGEIVDIFICYDGFYPDMIPTSQSAAMILILDDHWFRSGPLREIHFRQAKLLSQTYLKPILSVGSDGITGLLGPHGEKYHMAKKEVGFLSTQLPLYSPSNVWHFKLFHQLVHTIAMVMLAIIPFESLCVFFSRRWMTGADTIKRRHSFDETPKK